MRLLIATVVIAVFFVGGACLQRYQKIEHPAYFTAYGFICGFAVKWIAG